MAAANRKSSDTKTSTGVRFVYQEFGSDNVSAAMERAVPELPASQQNVRVQASRKGRKGNISGFQAKSETLEGLVKQLKTQCGTSGPVKEDTIEIQGDHTQKLVQVLTKLGYKAKISGG